MAPPETFAVIGGGVAGLQAAHQLKEAGEKRARLQGCRRQAAGRQAHRPAPAWPRPRAAPALAALTAPASPVPAPRFDRAALPLPLAPDRQERVDLRKVWRRRGRVAEQLQRLPAAGGYASPRRAWRLAGTARSVMRSRVVIPLPLPAPTRRCKSGTVSRRAAGLLQESMVLHCSATCACSHTPWLISAPC